MPGKKNVLEVGRRLVEPFCAKHPDLALVHDAITGKLSWDLIDPAGWVINSLAIAFWALREFDTFEAGMIEVVNLRGDSDTNGAIYGGLAGAVYGFDAIPERWVGRLKMRGELEKTVNALTGI